MAGFSRKNPSAQPGTDSTCNQWKLSCDVTRRRFSRDGSTASTMRLYTVVCNISIAIQRPSTLGSALLSPLSTALAWWGCWKRWHTSVVTLSWRWSQRIWGSRTFLLLFKGTANPFSTRWPDPSSSIIWHCRHRRSEPNTNRWNRFDRDFTLGFCITRREHTKLYWRTIWGETSHTLYSTRNMSNISIHTARNTTVHTTSIPVQYWELQSPVTRKVRQSAPLSWHTRSCLGWREIGCAGVTI